MKRLLKQKDGYILVWVLCIFLVITLISTITISSAVMSTASTENQHNSQQAYYTAKSAAATVAQYIMNNSNDTEKIESLMDHQGSGNVKDMGDYTVDISYVNVEKTKIKVLAKAIYRNETAIVSAYLVKPSDISSTESNASSTSSEVTPVSEYKIVPTEQIIYTNNDAGTGFSECKIDGNVFIDGDATLSGSDAITGDLYITGNLTMSGSSRIYGNAYIDGSLIMTSGSGVITEDAVVGKNASFGGGGNKINGKLYYGGTITLAWGSINDFVADGAEKIYDYTSVGNTQPIPTVSAPTQEEMPELYDTVVISDNTISNNGTLTAAVIKKISKLSYGATVTIDATTKDINLLLNNTSFNPGSGINIAVDSDGTHNVYIYMTGSSSSFIVGSNQFIGNKDKSLPPHLYIIGDNTQTVTLNNCELDACIYIPNGSFNASGSALYDYIFKGTCTVKTVSINSGVKLLFSPPNINNTPLDVFTSAGSISSENSSVETSAVESSPGNSSSGSSGSDSSGGGVWKIESWGSK